MASFKELIARTESETNKLHQAIHDTVKNRDVSPSNYEAWQHACAEFHAYQSPIADMLESCETHDISSRKDLRGFAFAYLEASPYYFRSGYTLEFLLSRIKDLDLTKPEKALIRKAILRRIHNGGRREFRALCRLIPKITTDAFADEVTALANAPANAVRHRAEIAVTYLP